MKNNNGFVGLFLAIVVAVIVLAGGAYLVTRPTSPPPIFQDQPDATVNTQSNTNANTTTTIGWKTYINTDPSFSFKYPSSWEEPTKNQQSTRNWIDFGNGFSVTEGFYYNQEKGRNTTIQELVNGLKENATIEEFQVDGHKAIRVNYNSSSDVHDYTEVFIYQNPQTLDSFIELAAENSVDSSIFNQILSTFKFTSNQSSFNWNSLSDSDLVSIISKNKDLYFMPEAGLKLSQTVDLTGDGATEAVISGTGDKAGVYFILIHNSNGTISIAKLKEQYGTTFDVYLIAGGSATHTSTFKLLPSENGFYAAILEPNIGNIDSDRCSGPDSVRAYVWNSTTKLFEWNQTLTAKYTAQVCQ